MLRIKDQKKDKRLWKAFFSLASVCLILALTGCEESNDSALKETEETEQTEYVSESEVKNETEVETEVSVIEDPVYQVSTNASNLYVREDPDADSEIITKLSNGEFVTGTGETLNGWIQVYCSSNNSDKDQKGWASGNYLRSVTDQNTEMEAVDQTEIAQEADELMAEEMFSQIEDQIAQEQEEVTLDGYMNWLREIVQEIDAGNLAAASELSKTNITEDNVELARWIFESFIQWMEKGYIVLDESGQLAYAEGGMEAAGEELIQEIYAWADQQEQAAQYQEAEQGQDDEQYQDVIQIQEEEPAQVEAVPQVCGNCGGSGLIEVDTRTVCAICGGTGMQYIPDAFYDTIMGWQGTYVGCGGCGGSGYTGSVYYDTCSVCGGSGYL